MAQIAMSPEDMRLSGGTVTDSKKKYLCKDFYPICMIYHTFYKPYCLLFHTTYSLSVLCVSCVPYGKLAKVRVKLLSSNAEKIIRRLDVPAIGTV